MSLVLNGIRIPVVQMGPDFIFVETPSDHPPGVGRLFLEVDEAKRNWEISLPKGISAQSKRVPIALCP